MSIRWQYRLLLWLLFPLVVLHGWRHGRREQETAYLRQRLGKGHAQATPGAIWLHAASVGEVNASLPLLRALANHWPERPLLLTTTTASGARIARKHLPKGAQHAFLPLDYPFAIQRFLARHQPRCALIMETELWPNLYQACAEREIPLLIINGRLSSRTLRAGRWLRRLYRHTLAQVSAILARSPRDADGFIELGAQHCEVIGNIKFAAAPNRSEAQPITLSRPFVLAASTREGEEALLLQAWRQLRTQHPEVPLLVIAPRHPQRREAILHDLAGERVAVRSRNEPIDNQTTVYLADTFGELTGFIGAAEMVFVGASLVNKGGQNLLEPAAQGKAILFGPHMENFRDEADTLLAAKAAIQVADATELATRLEQLLSDPSLRTALGEAARKEVDARRDMATRYLTAIQRHCAD